MSDFQRISANEWQWQKGSRHHSVRYFPSTDKLIWSGWADTSNGPVFEQGYTQSVADFLQDGVPHLTPPQVLLDELHTALSEHMADKTSSKWFGWLTRWRK
ncbi:MAG: hypothetical protein ACFE0Q_08230 [Anaerolineae bacterium]